MPVFTSVAELDVWLGSKLEAAQAGAVRGLAQGGRAMAATAAAQVRMDRYDTGALFASIAAEGPIVTGAAAEVDVVAGGHAAFVEYDTVPHWPPIAAITPWAERHGIPPFLVARAISQHGGRGIHFMRNAYAMHRDTTVAAVAAGVLDALSAP